MGLLDFFRKPKSVQKPASPAVVVEFDEVGVTCTRPNGSTENVTWSELRAVIIKTTGNGPFVDDLYWMLVGRKSGCLVPSEAQGCDRLLERLQRLPNFDNKAVILASQ